MIALPLRLFLTRGGTVGQIAIARVPGAAPLSRIFSHMGSRTSND